MSNNKCKHDFVHEGVRFRLGALRPGSGARDVEYFDSYFCRHCLERVTKSIGVHGHSYEAIRFNARPM